MSNELFGPMVEACLCRGGDYRALTSLEVSVKMRNNELYNGRICRSCARLLCTIPLLDDAHTHIHARVESPHDIHLYGYLGF